MFFLHNSISPGRFYTFLNVGIVVCSFVESYLFPFAMIKWLFVLTKHSSLVTALKTVPRNPCLRSQYSYTLNLVTSSGAKGLRRNESHVKFAIEDYGSDSCMSQLSFCGQECTKIPPALGKMYGHKAVCLDLSYNSIQSLHGLQQFTLLEELILDNNRLSNAVVFPYMPNLKTLSLNNNKITELESLLAKISEHLPGLTYLSLLKNAACPDRLSDAENDDSDYQRYRYFVIHKVPCLRFLDSRRIWSAERAEAQKRGEFTRVRRANPEPAPQPPTNVPKKALPIDLGALGKHKGAYGKCHYKYTGKNSEGNRFIVNSDL